MFSPRCFVCIAYAPFQLRFEYTYIYASIQRLSYMHKPVSSLGQTSGVSVRNVCITNETSGRTRSSPRPPPMFLLMPLVFFIYFFCCWICIRSLAYIECSNDVPLVDKILERAFSHISSIIIIYTYHAYCYLNYLAKLYVMRNRAAPTEWPSSSRLWTISVRNRFQYTR